VFRALGIGEAKWCKEHIPRKGNDLNDLTDEGISRLDDMELLWENQNLLWVCHTSRKKDRMNIDGTFLPNQKEQSQQPSHATSTYARERAETRWGNG
jgi:hypothetical protein